jgi:predicted ester cyclase
MIGERNEVVVHWTVRGTHKGPFLGMQPTNRPCTVSGTSISRMEGGKLVEHWADWNVMTLMEQLGVSAPSGAEEKVSARKELEAK